MKRVLPVIVIALLATAAIAQTVPDVSLPDTIAVKPGRMIKVQATTKDPASVVYWDTGGLVPGTEFDLIKLDNTSAIMLFPTQGKYKIGALVATAKDKLCMAYTYVVVGDPGPGPGPTPPVPPTPPTPPGPGKLAAAMILYESADESKLPKA